MGRWNDLIGVLSRTVDVTSDGADKAKLLRRIAALWIEKFGNFKDADGRSAVPYLLVFKTKK